MPTAEREHLRRMDTGAMFCLYGALLGRTHWATTSRVGRAGDRLVRVWRGLRGPRLSLLKIKERDVFNTCVFVKTLDLQPCPPFPHQYLQAE